MPNIEIDERSATPGDALLMRVDCLRHTCIDETSQKLPSGALRSAAKRRLNDVSFVNSDVTVEIGDIVSIEFFPSLFRACPDGMSIFRS